jgi:hypothetical protein
MSAKTEIRGPGFKLFNNLSGTTHIETSEEAQQIGNLLNLKSSPTATLLSVTWEPTVYQPDNDDDPFRDLTVSERDLVVFDSPAITLGCSISDYCGDGETTEHQAPNGKNFTVRDMVKAVCENQQQTRGQTDWFGGIDVHHIYFEGLNQSEGSDVWTISWGS